jgi:hypothetical protein
MITVHGRTADMRERLFRCAGASAGASRAKREIHDLLHQSVVASLFAENRYPLLGAML